MQFTNTTPEIIFQQLGGNKFMVMTGAKNLCYSERGISFKLPRMAKDKITHVKITLDQDDTYTMDFLHITLKKYDVIAQAQNVYWYMLRSIFTMKTGLETSL